MRNRDVYIGRRFGNYHITDRIACGAYGCVYRAQHTFLPRIVAIKLLHTARLHSQDACDKFFQEATLLEKLKHPHILPIYEFGIDRGLPYLITEYASGGSLRDLLRQRSPRLLSLADAISIVSQIGEAVYYAHMQGVIHLDLKPENILFNSKGEVLLADFGISIVQDTITMDQVTQVIGTPTYMAPEQFQRRVSQKSDQYSLGCVLYELLTGYPPFTGRNAISIGLKHLQQTPLPPSQFNPTIPPHIEYAILKALEKNYNKRYPTILTFTQELQAFPITQMHTPNKRRNAGLTLMKKTEMQYLNEGYKFYALGQYWDALAAYEQAIALDPQFDAAYYGKGNTFYRLRYYEEALLAFEHAIRLDSYNAILYSNKGSTLYALGRYEEALDAYEQALYLDPHFIHAQRGRNLTLRQLGNRH